MHVTASHGNITNAYTPKVFIIQAKLYGFSRVAPGFCDEPSFKQTTEVKHPQYLHQSIYI